LFTQRYPENHYRVRLTFKQTTVQRECSFILVRTHAATELTTAAACVRHVRSLTEHWLLRGGRITASVDTPTAAVDPTTQRRPLRVRTARCTCTFM